jgi:hypothetical protein
LKLSSTRSDDRNEITPVHEDLKLTRQKMSYVFASNQSGFECIGSQVHFDFKAITKDDYHKQLRQFVKDLKIEKLSDKEGAAVELPMGLKDIQEEAARK